MNYSTAVFLINPTTRAVLTTYEPKEGHPKVTFKTFDGTIMPGDLVVVPTKTRHGMTVVKVTDVDVEVDIESPVEVCWIISKVNELPYKQILAHEGEAIAKMKSAQRAKKMRELAATMQADTEELKSLSISTIGIEPSA